MMIYSIPCIKLQLESPKSIGIGESEPRLSQMNRDVTGQESQGKVSKKRSWSEKSGKMASKSVKTPLLTNIFKTFL